MASSAHEALLRQGVDEWNDWRAQNGSVVPDLRGLRMPAIVLAGIDFSHAKLQKVMFIRANLKGADLRYADLRNAELHEIDLTGADLFRANLEGAVLASAKLKGARFRAANLRSSQLTVADFRGADFSEADLAGADLREARGQGARFAKTRLSRAVLTQCQLQGANLERVEGLVSKQIEAAHLDVTTLLPESLGGLGADDDIDSLCKALEAVKARTMGDSVPETEVGAYHALLERLTARGFDVRDARIAEPELVRPITSWERTAGGEAFEVDPVRWVESATFRRKLDALLARLRS